MTAISQRFLALAMALAVVAFVAPERAHANGQVIRFVRQLAGPYEIAMGTIPATPSVGALHLTITVADASSKRFILDAEVAVTGRAPDRDGAELGPLVAQNNPSDPTWYDLNTMVGQEGTWVFTVTVSSDLGEASADFQIEVRKSSPLAGIATLLLLIALLSILGLSARAYFRERGKSRRRKSSRGSSTVRSLRRANLKAKRFIKPSLTVLVLLGSLAVLTACGGESEPQDREIDLAIRAGNLDLNPAVIEVIQGDNVTFRVDSDEHGTLHLHGYDIEISLDPDGYSHDAVHGPCYRSIQHHVPS